MGKIGTVLFEQGLSALLETVSLARRFGEVKNNVQFPQKSQLSHKPMEPNLGSSDAQGFDSTVQAQSITAVSDHGATAQEKK
jgi:hypothetical protein